MPLFIIKLLYLLSNTAIGGYLIAKISSMKDSLLQTPYICLLILTLITFTVSLVVVIMESLKWY